MKQAIRIGIVGDYQAGSRTHGATEAAIQHAAAVLGIEANSAWLATETLATGDVHARIARCDGLWIAPAAPT